MILIALGSNLESPEFGGPQQVLEAALDAMPSYGVTVLKVSTWYSSAPVPISDQPWFTNGVASVKTNAQSSALLARLHEIEARFGRTRGIRNESRVLDLDLLAYGRESGSTPGGLILPHPRIAERAFVLEPLAEIAGQWRHPLTGLTPHEMLERLPEGQRIRRMA